MSTPDGDIRVSDNPDQLRYEVHYDGELAGFAEYRVNGDTLELHHTEVDDRFEGKGLGSKLASGALDGARARGAKVVPTCSFIKGYIERHDQYADLVAPG